MAVDVVLSVDAEDKRCVRQSFRNRPEIHNVLFITAEDKFDITENLAMCVSDILVIESPELFKIVELEDGGGRVFLVIEIRELLQVILDQPLPEESVVLLLSLLVCFYNVNKLLRESFCPETMPQQHLAAIGSLHHIKDPALVIRDGIHLVLLLCGLIPGIKRGVFILMERILREVIITAADVGVMKFFFSKVKRPDIVLAVILVVDDELHGILVLQVIELLFLVSKNDCDVVNPGFFQLFDLTLDQALPLDFIETFRLFK